MKARVIMTTALVLGIGATGCGKKEKQAEQEQEDEMAARIVSKAVSMASGQDTKVEIDGDKVTFQHGDGKTTVHGGKGVKFPDDFPKDIPVYKDAQILHMATQNKDAFSVSMQTKDPFSKVADFYKQGMASEGWESDTAMDLPHRAILAYKKGERVVSLIIAGDKDGGAVITLTAGVDK